jgi:hypothetical protein
LVRKSRKGQAGEEVIKGGQAGRLPEITLDGILNRRLCLAECALKALSVGIPVRFKLVFLADMPANRRGIVCQQGRGNIGCEGRRRMKRGGLPEKLEISVSEDWAASSMSGCVRSQTPAFMSDRKAG